VHLDLSFNAFKKGHIDTVGEGLKRNHSILGVHLRGNEGSVDELGFAVGEEEKSSGNAALDHIFTRIPSKGIAFHF